MGNSRRGERPFAPTGYELCGKSRIEFLQILKEEGVFLNYDDAELDRDLANMESSGDSSQ